MTARWRVTLLLAVLPGLAAPAQAQLGEVQVGVIGSQGLGQGGRRAPGLVVGLAGARLVYIGVRGTRDGETRTDAATSTVVTDHATLLALDLAAIIPAGPLEVMPGVSLGALRHDQHTAQGATTNDVRSTNFLVAPSLSAELHAGSVGLIPEVQYQFSGRPDLAYPVRRVGWLVSLRVVFVWEVGRVRT